LLIHDCEWDPQASKDGYRTVITKTCENRKNDEMLFSAFANIDETTETSIEMIGKDATTGVYTFYEVIDKGQWVFYGNSFDFVGNGYSWKDSGFCVSNNSKKASSPSGKSCASCHISGGLVMKELDSPWLHWTTSHTNGSEDVVKKHAAKLGNQQNGEDLEIQVVRPSFDPYNEKRAELLATKGVAELVRPIFCTMDVNLNSGTGDTNLFLDAEITQSSFTFDDKIYADLKKEAKQRINGLPAKIDDTASPFTYPTRGQIDTSYSAVLQKKKLLDEEFVSDVLSVDFTRPIFSGARCGLVNVIQGKTQALDGKLASWAAEQDARKRDGIAADIAKGIPELFKDALKSASKPAEKKLLANLTDAKANVAAHEKEANDFVAKCEERLTKGDAASKKAATKDIMLYASHVRRVMRKDVVGFNGQDLLEGGGNDDKMVTDDLPDTNKAFDPTDCKLTLDPSDVK
jgi:hypothetical protein